MTEGVFQSTRRLQLGLKREMLDGFRERLKATKHEIDYPGRIDAFLAHSEAELNDAEQLIPLMHEGVSQKAWWIAFRAKLELAEKYMVMAEADAGVVRDRELMESRKKPRRQDINDWLDIQLARRPEMEAPELWSKFKAHWDSIGEEPPIGIHRLKKRATKSRKRLGIGLQRRE